MTETSPKTSPQPSARPARKENFFANLLLNIVIPTLILTKLSGDDWLGSKWAIVAAVAFPLAYGLRDLLRDRKVNFFSALGIISVLLTGGISLLELPAEYIAIKEAAIPGLLGVATIASLYTRWPLVETLIYNDVILDTAKIARTLDGNGNRSAFTRTLQQATWMIASSFFLSSALNYVLAKLMLQSPPGTEAFNIELGKMTMVSYGVIFVPSMIILISALSFLIYRIVKLTGLKLEEVVAQQ